MAYKTIIGLEIHTELMTDTKIFCSCTTEFGGESNTHTCPVCLGLPGALPVLNKKVVEYGIKSGIAFNSKIANKSNMDRKNYFYPDLVKGYQISQDETPLCDGGFLEIDTEEGKKKIRLMRIHIEEDTGKSVHTEAHDTLLDYNRSGVPLAEIVTEPDMNSPEEARSFLEKLRATLRYIGVSDCKMEEGSLRCDVNINVVDENTGEKTNVTELKNLNSFSAAVKAMEYEEKRHISLLEEGKNTIRETRRWDEVKNETVIMREKKEASDYRYFPEPDILVIDVEDEWIEEIRKSLPELPEAKKSRFMEEYDLPEYDAEVLTDTRELADFYEETVKYCDDPKQVSNWIMGDVLRRVNDEELEIDDIQVSPKTLAELIGLVNGGKISNNIGKEVLKGMFETGKDPKTIVKEKGLIQISDEDELKEVIEKVINENQQSVIDYRNGKDRALGYLVGQVMKATRGKANPQKANKMILEIIEE
ncbi:MAG TPA: Asp-tRNA(Asn)/Glu-tRNA(Gln) amidotransferase subunit GatB [Tissierellales bacterium]|nr:Asp-tRNA(Asn)/Glu-tRNA(Gln) amidotransferase subunit GatB [Tissierellales bacterium]